ncbi:hypothetical protein I6A60_07695 [Frankia sp. AgB1.9]|uniref:hypothetical protein n=1 Tax=unclassified Frankia TaxID=2632575 RepID=UPI001932C4C7|nr:MULTISPECIES: hypothetical protein [unclassified Frankia]MBL7491258.1 hypothetical protein [Frankia sp. AgW1.1]MBL7547755.1 hypothetical protein [Frankia sp. AgB1.9]MBL7621289.1 hypothetical protein [Frankia sp. AgB1.8]
MSSSPRTGDAFVGRDSEKVTLGRVNGVINGVANDIMDHLTERTGFASDLDSGVTDALNLMVNATLYRLANTADSLAEVAVLAYGEPLETILDWIGGA